MKKFLYVFGLLLLVSCGASIDDVKTGMSEAEVIEILGEPDDKNSNTVTYTFDGVTSSTTSSNWTYEDKGIVDFQDGMVVNVKDRW